jgi:multiple sugar transport system substrate-binding protein
MKKRVIASLLIAAMTVGLAACGSGSSSGKGSTTTDVSGETTETTVEGSDIVYNVATDLTTDKIELTYFHFDQDETVQYLADRFMELYPNITVNVVYENVSTYDDTLLTLVSNGETPDVIMFSDCDFALSNQLLTDISGFYDTDPETQNLASTINDCGIGMYGTSARFAVPVKFFPGVMYVDANVLETLNVDLPARDWTWSDMIQLIKDCTVQDSPDGMAYYGCGYYNRLDSYYGIASSQSVQGEFGFDGTSFDLSAWAVGEQEFSNLKLGGYIAPTTETQEMEDWAGDWEAWCGATGHVALFTEAFWTYQGTWATENYEQYNLDIIPYVVPAVSEEDATADHHTIATIDFGGVTTSCKYPREAYELLKFMSFGVDGWLTRIELYNNTDYVNSSGLALKYDVMPAPITTNEEVWSQYIDMYCADMDDEHRGYWEEYFASCMQPIPYGWTSIAGYWNYCAEYFNSIGIHDLVDAGTAQAADYVDEATMKANLYHAQAMLDYFGESGYNILSEDEIALYTQMVEDNSN